jgi:hypothetical protein
MENITILQFMIEHNKEQKTLSIENDGRHTVKDKGRQWRQFFRLFTRRRVLDTQKPGILRNHN